MSDSISHVSVPPGFTSPSGAYRFRAWLAFVGLLLFVALYLGLAFWFSYTVYRLWLGVLAGGDGAVASFFTSIPPLFLAVFMWKALLTFNEKTEDPGVEITSTDEPELFAFINQLADEIGSPRPYRVFLAPDVSASVYYDLTLWNMVFPSRKNLIIGLGLVNSLNRTEFKAVIAHELGHFAQRVMAVGSWVYVGRRIAAHIIVKRDYLDQALDWLSGFDLRLAWIGWIMQTVVWAIRSFMETVFGWVMLANQALTREMEFQADRVAVSVTGSDAIVHALYHTSSADTNWRLSLAFAHLQFGDEQLPGDLYLVQSRIHDHLQRIMPEPTKKLSRRPGSNTERVFSEQLAQPPRMWSSHPSNVAREENAKATYIPSRFNEDSAWSLFSDRTRLGEQLTQHVFQETLEQNRKIRLLPREESLEQLDREYSLAFLDPAYRGAYLYGRQLMLHVASIEEMLQDAPAREELKDEFERLYPDSMVEQVIELNRLQEELALLEGIRKGTFEATGKELRHRDQAYSQRQLPLLIEKVEQERDVLQATLAQHDHRSRTVHSVAARYVAYGWQDYHQSVMKLLHYAEHNLAEVIDAHRYLANLTQVTLLGRASEKKIRSVIQAANDLHVSLKELHGHHEQLQLPEPVANDSGVRNFLKDWKFELPRATRQNIGQWLNVIDGWYGEVRAFLESLRAVTLDELLRTEEQIRNYHHRDDAREHAPPPASVPDEYSRRLKGTERKDPKLDWWAWLKSGIGWFPQTARFLFSLAIVAGVVLAGSFVGGSSVMIVNGLETQVVVHLNQDQQVTLMPGAKQNVSIGSASTTEVEAYTASGRLIESFDANTESRYSQFVYNVGGGVAMVRWTAVYGNAIPVPPQPLGFPHWRSSSAQILFSEPPNHVDTDSQGAQRTVLTAIEKDDHPSVGLEQAKSPEEAKRAVLNHARFDDTNSPHFAFWFMSAANDDEFDALVAERLEAEPNEVAILRLLQQIGPESRPKLLEEHRAFADQFPDDPGMQYLAVRAMDDGQDQDEAFLKLLQKWPDDPWVNNGAGFVFVSRNQWRDALQCFDKTFHAGVEQSGVGMMAARLRRLLGDEAAQVSSRYWRSWLMQQVSRFQRGRELQGTPQFAYSKLNRGELGQASNLIKTGDTYLAVLLGCSEGAPISSKKRVLQIDPADLDSVVMVAYVAALAKREGKPAKRYYDRMETLLENYNEEDANGYRMFIQLLRDGLDRFEDDEFIRQERTLSLELRGSLAATAVIIDPENVEAKVRHFAREVLFCTERPYFLPTTEE